MSEKTTAALGDVTNKLCVCLSLSACQWEVAEKLLVHVPLGRLSTTCKSLAGHLFNELQPPLIQQPAEERPVLLRVKQLQLCSAGSRQRRTGQGQYMMESENKVTSHMTYAG